MLSNELVNLLSKALAIKKRFLRMYKFANAGHIGSSLSCAEMLTFVKFACMKDTDHFILSKGHAAAALYSTLAEAGNLSEGDIESFYKNGTYLPAHPPANKIKGIPFATGSLGHGLSLAAGFGMASKLRKDNRSIYCITSDGELNEGSTWEAAMFISQHRLTNVIWLIDRNRFQGFGSTEEVMNLDPLSQKLESFGFTVLEVDGHDFNDLLSTRKGLLEIKKPIVIICNTTKGRGWSLENTLDSHYLPFKDDEYNAIIHFLDEEYSLATSVLKN